MDSIETLISNNQFSEAKELLEKHLADNKKDVEALKLLGICSMTLKYYEEGRSIFEQPSFSHADRCDPLFHLRRRHSEHQSGRQRYGNADRQTGPDTGFHPVSYQPGRKQRKSFLYPHQAGYGKLPGAPEGNAGKPCQEYGV